MVFGFVFWFFYCVVFPDVCVVLCCWYRLSISFFVLSSNLIRSTILKNNDNKRDESRIWISERKWTWKRRKKREREYGMRRLAKLWRVSHVCLIVFSSDNVEISTSQWCIVVSNSTTLSSWPFTVNYTNYKLSTVQQINDTHSSQSLEEIKNAKKKRVLFSIYWQWYRLWYDQWKWHESVSLLSKTQTHHWRSNETLGSKQIQVEKTDISGQIVRHIHKSNRF